jgi:hypothetical protein
LNESVLIIGHATVAIPLLFSGTGSRREQRMHIHSSPSASQMMALGATQSTQQSTAVRKAAAEVRRKLTAFAANGEDEAVARVDPRADPDPDKRRNPQQDDDQFRSVFFSASV